MIVEWIQHPAGHGGFHTGHVRLGDDSVFNWIFDCGARSTTNFDKLVKSWAVRNRSVVDWLFISHFDTDHVSGLDTLLASTVVDDVMLPYVNEGELAFALLYEIGRGNSQRSFVELVADPAEFFLSRGAQRVTFLGGPRRPEFSEPVTGFPGGPSGDKPSGRIGSKLIPGPTTASQPGNRSIPKRGGGHRVRVIEQDACEIFADSGEIGIRLKPYRKAVARGVLGGLRRSLRGLVGPTKTISGRPGLGGLAYAIALHARTAAGRGDLQKIFKSYVGSSNRASLSLLSIPYARHPTTNQISGGQWHMGTSGPGVFNRFHYEEPPAWLNTGDAELLTKRDLDAWAAVYSTELPSVRMLALPHHGSDKNSDLRLQDLCPSASLVAHVKESAKKHPGPIVSGAAGSRLCRVTEDTDSILRMWASLR
ncbi:MBL fold metallo-hydrolase [Rhizobium leguminosarum]|uniref:MBL fold metallo-hydrolase n=1 Tax=Rhizobium leguminosarum TaxID=384 RepID=UPI00103072CA|nr:MBL fold metallo-hydrolase [Rhizobium leguminosarum]TAY99675.1 hypothetical protein ELH79_14820 [Rhizobium leguminosarum]TAZ10545.1 hypothetical protein ELH78_15705 [Rhizobium leguminosarum]